ncbi:hypothetical protein [Bacillus seohaeanensis]
MVFKALYFLSQRYSLLRSKFVTDNGTAVVAIWHASFIFIPSSKETARTPLNVSLDPVVSATSTFNAGIVISLLF